MITIMEKITIPLLKFTKRLRKRADVVDIFGTLAEARTILVCMPYKQDAFGIAKNFISNITSDFPNASFQFVVRNDFHNMLNGIKQYGTIIVADKDVNMFGLPKNELMQKVFSTSYDIVIDLNDDFHLLSTYLCQKSSASLKICLDNRDRELFYNFYLRTGLHENLENKYRKLVQYLSVCTTSVSVAN